MTKCIFCSHYQTCKFVEAMRKLIDNSLIHAMEWGRTNDWIYSFSKYCTFYKEDTKMIENTIKAGLMFVFQSIDSDSKRIDPK